MLKDIKNKINKKFSQTRKRGLWWTLAKFFRDHVYTHQRHVFMARDLAAPHRTYSRKRNWLIRILENSENLEDFRANFPSKIEGIKNLFDQGHIAVVVYHEGGLVAYMWYAKNDYFDPTYNIVIHAQKKELYQTAGYILPKYRGTLIALDCMKYGQEYFKDQGYARTTCHVDTEHIPTLKLHFKLDFEEAGSILHMRKLLFYRWSTVEEYEGERFGQFKMKKPDELAVAREEGVSPA